MALFQLSTARLHEKHHVLFCDGDYLYTADTHSLAEIEHSVVVHFTRQYGRDEEFMFQIGVMCMGDWQPIMTEQEVARRHAAIGQNESAKAAQKWLDAVDWEFVVSGAYGTNVASQATERAQACIKKFLALMELDLFTVPITL